MENINIKNSNTGIASICNESKAEVLDELDQKDPIDSEEQIEGNIIEQPLDLPKNG